MQTNPKSMQKEENLCEGREKCVFKGCSSQGVRFDNFLCEEHGKELFNVQIVKLTYHGNE